MLREGEQNEGGSHEHAYLCMRVRVCMHVYVHIRVSVYLDHERAPCPSRMVAMRSFLRDQAAEAGGQRLWGRAGVDGCLMYGVLGSTQQPAPTDQMGSRLL